MSEPFASEDWYRVAASRPRLRPDVMVRTHHYRGRPWFVLTEPAAGKVHRLSLSAYRVVGRLDGQQTVGNIWQAELEARGTDAPTQAEVVQVLGQLHQADLLEGEAPPDMAEAVERQGKERRQKIMKTALNPLAITLPLIDPNRPLGWLARYISLVPSGLWWLAATAFVLPALILAGLEWEALTAQSLDRLLDAENLLAIALIYPVVKAIHELAHGLAIRVRGGEVHEMGVMLIAFFPIPYVEATASLRFPSKWDRAAVAGAGIAAEVTIAAGAFYIWQAAEPGLLKSLAFNTMVIAGLSTVLVNANPLLRFDGYHVLCDLAELPNLGRRANAWWGEQARLRVLRTGERDLAPVMRSEAVIFALYAPAAFAYKVWIAFTIALFVAGTYFAVGMILAVWSLALTLLWPAAKTLHKAFTDERIRRHGARAARRGGLAAAALIGLVAVIPVPSHTVTEGVVWLPPEAILRAGGTGWVEDVTARHGAQISAGAPVLRLRAPDTKARLHVAEAEARRLQIEAAGLLPVDRAAARARQQAAAAASLRAQDAAVRVQDLSLEAGVSGRLDLPLAGDMSGRFVSQGDPLGHVLPDGPRVVRAVVEQGAIDRVRNDLRSISVRLAEGRTSPQPGTLHGAISGGDTTLPSRALTLEGGGPFATVPGGEGPPQALTRVFLVDIALPAATPGQAERFGQRAYVRFTHGPEPMAVQLWRSAREVFLGLAA